MHRLLILIVPTLCVVSLYGEPIGCTATASLTVQATTGTTIYSPFGEGNATGCFFGGSFGTLASNGYVVTLTASTQSDPVIDFGMNFDGSSTDPVVTLTISTPYSGGPYKMLYTTGSGTITDTDLNGSASALPTGDDIQTVKVNGNTVSIPGTQNPGCSASGEPGFSSPCGPPTAFLTDVASLANTSTGTLELDVSYQLSVGDSYNVSGSASLTPEPATGVLLGAGLVAIAALARRRCQTAAMALSRSSNV